MVALRSGANLDRERVRVRLPNGLTRYLLWECNVREDNAKAVQAQNRPCHSALISDPPRPRNTKTSPANGSRPRLSCTNNDKPCMPLRMSVWPVAIQVRDVSLFVACTRLARPAFHSRIKIALCRHAIREDPAQPHNGKCDRQVTQPVLLHG
jgi:hypothetical protein